MKKYIKYVITGLMVIVFGFCVRADDKELFMGQSLEDNIVRPNVVILMDSSISMNTIIFYPKKGVDGILDTPDDGYDANITYTGTVESLTSEYTYMSQTGWYARWQRDGNADILDKNDLYYNGENFWTGCYAGDGTPNNFQCGSNGWSYFREGDLVLFYDTRTGNSPAVAKLKRKYTGTNGEPWFELEDIVGGPITPSADNNVCYFQQAPDGKDWHPVIANLYGTVDNGQQVLYPSNYLRWLFIHATDDMRAAVTHFSTWGTFKVGYEPPVQLSNCATPGNDDLSSPNPRIKQVFTRIQAAREVICNVANTSNTIVKLGLFKFTFENGADLVEGLTDMSDESSELVAYKNNVWDIYGGTYTPLAESLADIWYYYKPGPSSKTYWPVDWEIEYGTVNHSVSNPVTPVDWWCQKNYVVVMTDGESTKDGFDSTTKYGTSIFKKKPVTRTEPWTTWNNGWGDPDRNDVYYGRPLNYNPTTSTYCPNYTCWTVSMGGTDYLDDVAYFIRHQDMFPDSFFGTDPDIGWPGEQNIFTYTIGFNADNHMLLQTAINGDGAYYTATNYDELVEAFQLVITSINLRNYAFSSITAPRKTATATNDELTLSYVGYFMPSQAAPIWEGHLVAFRLIDLWGFDTDDPANGLTPEEYVYDSEEDCLNASNGVECQRSLVLNIGHEWDAADHVPLNRSLYTHNVSPTLISFDSGSRDILMPLFGSTVTEAEADQIIEKIRLPQFADVFHSDVGFVGAPPFGRKYVPNIDPTGTGDQLYEEFYNANQNRSKVLYVGTNDGILHMIQADKLNAGTEMWGFIPDEVLPSMKNIVINSQHTYTVDGRLTADDIYFVKPGESVNTWSTILVFGMRRGGNAFYCMDITNVSSQPKLLWKFKDPDGHSGQSFGKAVVGKIRILDPDDNSSIIDKWVAIVPGGFAFNSFNPTNVEGKAVFVIDAATGQPLWKIAYDPTDGDNDVTNAGKEIIDVNTNDPGKHLTKSELFNYPIPSALTATTDKKGYLDTIYFGNVAGHLFKTDISNPDMAEWTTYLLYRTIIAQVQSNITAVNDSATPGSKAITVDTKVFNVGQSIMGLTSYATGHITGIDNKVLTVNVTSGAFQSGETVIYRSYDPIYLSPAIALDTCGNQWVAFGTGDRDRPRTNPEGGRFITLIDNESYTNTTLADLSELSFGTDNEFQDTSPKSTFSSKRGFYINFSAAEGEKLFDPEPLILPDSKTSMPHIFYNSYRPPQTDISVNQDNPCATPGEGNMTLYEIVLNTCGTTEVTVEGEKQTGRIAGGGIYTSKEYLFYKSESGQVADVPGRENDGTEGNNFIPVSTEFPYTGGIIFWKEKKR
jgi:hypothetical protein